LIGPVVVLGLGILLVVSAMTKHAQDNLENKSEEPAKEPVA
jgi:hypothetical protein